MAAIDHRKTLKHLYVPSARAAALVEVPPLRFLMIDGRGDPNTAPEYPLAVSALFTLAYSLKFALKRELGQDYAVMPLEGLWWADDLRQFRLGGRDEWQWTMLIAQPEEVTAERLATACEAARKKVDPSVLARVRLETYHEGLSAQVLHRGPYAAEAPTIEALHAFIAAQEYVPTGKHHEIYLKDPQRTAPERLETVIRQPVAPAAP